jgi:hypothetical protein
MAMPDPTHPIKMSLADWRHLVYRANVPGVVLHRAARAEKLTAYKAEKARLLASAGECSP